MVVTAVGLRAFAVWLEAQPGDLPPIAGVAAVWSQALTTLAFLAAGGFLLVRFPDGRHADRLTALVDVLVALTTARSSSRRSPRGRSTRGWIAAMDNPLGIEALAPLDTAAFGAAGLVIYAATLVFAVLEVMSRYRTADPVVRAQIRVGRRRRARCPWRSSRSSSSSTGCGRCGSSRRCCSRWPSASPLLRYRLFDIDRIVGRTIAYAIVTAILAGVFVVVNLALVALFADATRSNTLVVAASTLLVAALFQPIRRRVQAPVDRRFNRAHLDAERVVGTFARQTRDEVDLERLQDRRRRHDRGVRRPERDRPVAAAGAGPDMTRTGHDAVEGTRASRHRTAVRRVADRRRRAAAPRGRHHAGPGRWE